MSVDLECENCGHRHTIPDRPDDPDGGGTVCPACGAKPFVVRRGDLGWHPDP
ncbi:MULTISPECIES: hypothetical protein [Natronococcus]|uniref:Uncharacterized protein n=1 Tax=Natronococcus jeotgali DSM 18795 TaxID=1227498 RepID=L9X554_9EURY|nr:MULTISPECIES: hypothetical protein [Natronococcus]ELY56571.1 hypothetical protein C492_14511 [Natronococcus jeotgali DSM 18795]NKE37283.1 hypothetical protein [Natronococcus sp. JC468]